MTVLSSLRNRICFDVQPADPLELWDHPPFEPEIIGDRIYARGASDDKGNLMSPITAVEALLATGGSLPVNVKFLIEGQEEISSPQMEAFLANNREHLACDLAVSADGLQWSPDQPQIEVGARGMVALQIDVRGPAIDQHSGLYGGVIQKPGEIIRLVKRHIARHTLPGVKVEISEAKGRATPYLMPPDHPGNLAAAKVLLELYGKQPFVTRSGGTIAVFSMILDQLGVYTVGLAFSHEDENLHGPNEFFRLGSLDRGQKAYVLLLHELAGGLYTDCLAR